MPKRLEPSERQAILDDIEAGKLTRNAIARKHGRSVSTVTGIAQAAGHTDAFDRSQTQKGTQAREIDMAAARSKTGARFLMEANLQLDRLHEPCIVFSFGGMDNHYAEHEMAKPPSAEVRNFMTAAAVAMDKHMRADKHDSDDLTGASVDAWLRHVVGRNETSD